jgi:hypothetical protein
MSGTAQGMQRVREFVCLGLWSLVALFFVRRPRRASFQCFPVFHIISRVGLGFVV